jgi:hypothetical protein
MVVKTEFDCTDLKYYYDKGKHFYGKSFQTLGIALVFMSHKKQKKNSLEETNLNDGLLVV